ncbi:MAG: MOSC domain-containing protein [Hyphomicrobiaceae bacterium]|nr:MOSC domain-containing protein [Hyphomicrobiaceae bacterium]
MSPTIAAIYRYPVKGLSPEQLATVDLGVGGTLPGDRIYAVENGVGRFDPLNPRHLPKINFLMLMRDERLATLRTAFDLETHVLTIMRDGKQVARGDLSTKLGRQMIEQFFAAYMKAELRGAPHIVHADGHTFSDMAAHCVHIVNLATVRDIERAAGRSLDPLRFRANLYIEGLPAWEEFKWLDRTLAVGAVRLEVFDRTRRCEAVNVDPSSGVRDAGLPQLLQRTWGHSDVGIYAKVAGAGSISEGDAIAVDGG